MHGDAQSVGDGLNSVSGVGSAGAVGASAAGASVGGSFPSGFAGLPRIEPEKIRNWREQQRERLDKKGTFCFFSTFLIESHLF